MVVGEVERSLEEQNLAMRHVAAVFNPEKGDDIMQQNRSAHTPGNKDTTVSSVR